MFILKKLFNLRDKSSSANADKPFLAHLEDLRDVIIRIIATLLIATIVCFVFRQSLMEVLRRPIEQVWEDSEESKLPKTISPDTWELAKKAATRSIALNPRQRDHYFAQFDNKKLRFYAECATYYRAALTLETKEQQLKYIYSIPDIEQKTKDIVVKLIEKHPSEVENARSNTVFMRSLKPTETFMLSFKLSFFAAIIVSFPLLLYFILQFILPGLKEKERKALWPALAIGGGLFIGGVLFCYFAVLPKALDFFFTYSNDLGVENEWRIGEYIGFVTQFTLIFGLAFELPVVVMTLVKIGLLSYSTMSRTRSYAILAILVVAAIITPTGDALTLIMLGAPMCILYEICIWLAYFHNKKEQEQEEADLKAMQEYNARKAKENAAESDSSTTASDDSEEKPQALAPETPRIAPVPGRFYEDDEDEDEVDSNADEQDSNPEDDHSQHDEEWYPEIHREHHDPEFDHDEDEGAEEDDGEISAHHAEPESKSESEPEPDEDGMIFETDEDPNIDFNPGASFVPPSTHDEEPKNAEPESTDKDEDKDDDDDDDNDDKQSDSKPTKPNQPDNKN